jgi:hypothetical protein
VNVILIATVRIQIVRTWPDWPLLREHLQFRLNNRELVARTIIPLPVPKSIPHSPTYPPTHALMHFSDPSSNMFSSTQRPWKGSCILSQRLLVSACCIAWISPFSSRKLDTPLNLGNINNDVSKTLSGDVIVERKNRKI